MQLDGEIGHASHLVESSEEHLLALPPDSSVIGCSALEIRTHHSFQMRVAFHH
jgi:hypothetical protein